MLGLAPGGGQGAVVHAVFPTQWQLFNVTHREPAPNCAQSVSEAQFGAAVLQIDEAQHSDDPSTSRPQKHWTFCGHGVVGCVQS